MQLCNTYWRTFLLALPLVAVSGFGHTETTASSTAQTVTFVTIDAVPWAATDPETGEPFGAFVEIVDALEEKTGLNIQTALTPFARIDREMETGSHDCTISIPRDESIVVHGETLVTHDIGLVSLKEAPLDHLGALRDKRLSIPRGSSLSEVLEGDFNLTVEEDTDYLIALHKLQRGRVDGVAGAVPTIFYIAKQNDLYDLLAEPLKLSDVPLMLQCSRNSENLDLLPVLNKAIRSMREDGSLEAITDKYDF
ncbi:substrate-binding periplasmic protein [Marinimicrobium agarilyticum]|uniref:substrate-binding periplasmic protein n=1 Tax=Marinimicrobium agarilyticum TaxID=306546 RepID=UPI0004185E6A|nr:transporter substrate-binding domain-containing protein [Marinimicrobium agarilyticum]